MAASKSSGYDAVWHKKHPPHHFKTAFPKKILSIFKEHRVKKVLDLGSGDGTNAVFLAKKGFSVSAMEISAVGCKKAREKAKKWGHPVRVIRSDIFQPLPFADNAFDAAYSFQALHHSTLPNIKRLLAEISRVLRVGGILSLKVPDKESYHLNRIRTNIYTDKESGERLRLIGKQAYVPLEGPEKGIVHYIFYKKQLKDEVAKHGFALLHSEKTTRHILASFRKIG